MIKTAAPINSCVIVLILCLITLFPSACSAQITAEQARKTAVKLRHHIDNLSSLSFHFTQRTIGQLSGRPRQASGIAYFLKGKDGSKMRWNYLAPDTQVIISDGTTLTMYFEKLKQMIVTPAATMQQDITFSFFTGSGNIEDDFEISPGLESSENSAQEQSHTVIKLVPKSSTSQVKNIRLWVAKGTLIQRIEIQDNFDTITLLNLSNTEENSLVKDGSPINSKLFVFSPPEGTEIIHQ